MSRRIILVVLCVVFALGLAGFSTMAKDKALLVCVEESMNASDEAVLAKLGALGFDVTVIDHASAADENPAKYALVVISSTCTSANIVGAPGYIDSATPVLDWESALMDDYQYAPTTLGAWDFDEPVFAVTDKTHPIVAGLKASFPAYTGTVNLHSGVAEAGKVVAMIDGSDYVGILAVDKGEKLANGTAAPGRRVFIAAGDAAWESATADGWKVFEQAVKWLVRK